MSEQQTAINPDDTTTTYEVEPFYRKAMVLGSPALVHSIIMMPDSFEMPGFTLVALAEDAICEPGMLYDAEKGTFSAYIPSNEGIPFEGSALNKPGPDTETSKSEPEKEPEDIVNVDDTDPLTVGGDKPTE